MSYTAQAKLKPHKKKKKKTGLVAGFLTRLFGNILYEKKKKSLKILHRMHWPKGGRLPNSLQRFGKSKWLQYLISHVQFPETKLCQLVQSSWGNNCSVSRKKLHKWYKGFHDTSTASAIKMCCNAKFSRKLYMHKNKGCSRSQRD